MRGPAWRSRRLPSLLSWRPLLSGTERAVRFRGVRLDPAGPVRLSETHPVLLFCTAPQGASFLMDAEETAGSRLICAGRFICGYLLKDFLIFCSKGMGDRP